MGIFNVINQCRICSNSNLEEIINLGDQPPANSLRENADEILPKIPLTISRCPECTAIQLNETIDPEFLFKNYVWITGTSKTAHEYCQYFFDETIKRCNKGELFVVEIASNDGTFLRKFKEHGYRVLGVDPAENITEIANKLGVPTQMKFFSSKVAEEIKNEFGQADCIFARNVIPHVANLHDIMIGISTLLKDNGIGAIEIHHSAIILGELHYDSIYHEHLLYFSIRSLKFLLEKYKFFPFDIIKGPISGGSIVLYFSKGTNDFSPSLKEEIIAEERIGLGEKRAWQLFAKRCLEHREKLNCIVHEEHKAGNKMIGYGASARSSTLLNFCGIDKNIVHCIADQNAIKHNKFTPGTNIKITSPEESFKAKPDTILLLAWNFYAEIVEIMKEKFNFHGKVIIPLPNDPRIIRI